MIEFLFALINDPAISFMLGLSLGFFVRHIVAKNDEKSEKVRRDLYQTIINILVESNIKELNKDIQ